MSLRDILVFLDADTGSEARLRLAARMARENQAALSVAFLRDDRANGGASRPAAWFGPERGRHAGGADVAGAPASGELAEPVLRECLRWSGVQGEWHDIGRHGSIRPIALARAADLVVLGQVSPYDRPLPWWRPDRIIAHCGRPVLLVPYAGRFSEIGRRVLVAWDGSQEAARALNDALPLIVTATAVTVIAVHARDGQAQRDATQRVVRHLERHRIPARADHPSRCGNSIADVLLSAAMDLSADLIVAGGYHRSPLRQAIGGGVSRDLLRSMTVPVLMSH